MCSPAPGGPLPEMRQWILAAERHLHQVSIWVWWCWLPGTLPAGLGGRLWPCWSPAAAPHFGVSFQKSPAPQGDPRRPPASPARLLHLEPAPCEASVDPGGGRDEERGPPVPLGPGRGAAPGECPSAEDVPGVLELPTLPPTAAGRLPQPRLCQRRRGEGQEELFLKKEVGGSPLSPPHQPAPGSSLLSPGKGAPGPHSAFLLPRISFP
nr:basic salivary proline-rich protein 1-like isoform X3 [Zootoca vivipara]